MYYNIYVVLPIKHVCSIYQHIFIYTNTYMYVNIYLCIRISTYNHIYHHQIFACHHTFTYINIYVNMSTYMPIYI